MSMTILECTTDLITLSSFIKKNDVISISDQVERILNCTSNEWIHYASIAIKDLLKSSRVAFPVVIILPEFALLTKSIKVPRVASAKQSYVIHTHLAQFLGVSENEFLGFVIKSSNEIEMEVICSLVKKDWIESFCNAIEPIGIKIESMQSPIIHYYNAFSLYFPFNTRNVLLIVVHGLSASCIFISSNSVLVFRLQFKNSDFNSAIKELLEFCKKKYPENIPREVLISGLSHFTDDLVDALSKYIHLPIKTFAPLKYEPSLLGSIGFAYAKWVGKGLFIDLMPSAIRNSWAYKRNKKLFLFSGICVMSACSLLLSMMIYQQNRYESLIQAYESKIFPLRDNASIISHNEKTIKLYEEAFGTLQFEMQSYHSWVNFLNTLQTILAKIPGVQIQSLTIVNPEPIFENSWKHEMMGAEKVQTLASESRLLDLKGMVQIENLNKPTNEVIDDLSYLIAQLTKLDFIEDTKNLYFDMQSFPRVPFSFSLVLRPKAL